MSQPKITTRINRIFGISDDCESSWEECLSSGHLDHIRDCVDREEQREQVVADRFFASKNGSELNRFVDFGM